MKVLAVLLTMSVACQALDETEKKELVQFLTKLLDEKTSQPVPDLPFCPPDYTGPPIGLDYTNENGQPMTGSPIDSEHGNMQGTVKVPAWTAEIGQPECICPTVVCPTVGVGSINPVSPELPNLPDGTIPPLGDGPTMGPAPTMGDVAPVEPVKPQGPDMPEWTNPPIGEGPTMGPIQTIESGPAIEPEVPENPGVVDGAFHVSGPPVGPVGTMPPFGPCISRHWPPEKPISGKPSNTDSIIDMDDVFGQGIESMISQKCGIDVSSMENMGDLKPVDPDAFRTSFGYITQYAEEFSKTMKVHSAQLEALEDALQGQGKNPQYFVVQHGALFQSFMLTLGMSMENILCIKVHTSLLKLRLELAGTTGFLANTRCNRAGVLLQTILVKNNGDNHVSQEELKGNLDVIGEELGKDVRCMLNDIKDYSDFLQEIPRDIEKLEINQVILLVDTASKYLEDVSEDMFNLYQTTADLNMILMANTMVGKKSTANKINESKTNEKGDDKSVKKSAKRLELLLKVLKLLNENGKELTHK